jgi:hypothetical protein
MNKPAGSALVTAVALCCAPVFAIKLKSWDVWWHLATGRWIVDHGALPTTDPFSYTMLGKPWRLVNGISELVMYAAHVAAGDAGVVMLQVLFAALTVGLLGAALLELRSSRGATVSVLLLAALLLQARYSLARPLIMGASMLAASSWLSLRYLRTGDRRLLWFFLIAIPLWPLVHGNAVLGVAELVVVGGVAWHRRTLDRWLMATLAVCVVASVGIGWWRDLWAVALGLQADSAATALTAEWETGREVFGRHLGRWLLLFGALGGAFAARSRDETRPLWIGLAAWVVIALAIASRFGRNIYEAVVLSAPAFAVAVDGAASAFRARHKDLFALVTAPLAALTIAIVQLASAPLTSINGPWGFGVMPERYPYDTLATLRTLPEARLLNGFPIGGFLIWERVPVYCDGRTVALYRDDDVRRLFMPLIESAEALTAAASAWHAPYALAENDSVPNQWMMVSPEWTPVHIGYGTTLFARANIVASLPVHALHLVRYTSDARWTSGWYAGIVADPALSEQLLREMEHAAELSHHNATLVAIVAEVAALDAAQGEALAAMLRRVDGPVSAR